MKRAYVPSAIATFLLSLPACGPRMTTDTAAGPATATEMTLATSILGEVERYRAKLGRPRMKADPVLANMAREHSEFLRVNRGKFSLYGPTVSHYGADSRAFALRNSYGINQMGENVAAVPMAGKRGGAYIANLWFGSTLHRQCLSCDWPLTGMGVVIDRDGTAFVTELFGSMPHTGSHRVLLDRLRVH